MKTFLTATALTLGLGLAGAATAQSVNIALDSTPDRDRSGTYRYADGLMNELAAMGWDTERFPVDTIGGEDERLDQIRSGILDISMSNFAVSTQFVPEMRAMQLPYTFKNSQNVFSFFTGSHYLDEVNAKMAEQGMHILAVVPTGSPLGIFNNKHEVKSITDMAGLRMRALDANQLEMFKMMGASGVVIPFSEVPNALQTGVADGYVNSALVPLAFGQTDLLTNFTDAQAIISARLALASSSWWDGLSDTEKAQVEAASNKVLKEVFDWVDSSEAHQKADLEKAGVKVYEPNEEELNSFKEATKPMAGLLAEVSQDRIAELRKMVADYAPK